MWVLGTEGAGTGWAGGLADGLGINLIGSSAGGAMGTNGCGTTRRCGAACGGKVWFPMDGAGAVCSPGMGFWNGVPPGRRFKVM